MRRLSLILIGVIALVSGGCRWPPAQPERTLPRTARVETQPLTLTEIEMIDAQVGWGRSQDRCLWRTSDGGERWRDVTPPGVAAGADCGFHALNRGRAWVVTLAMGESATVYRTSDGGETWSDGVVVPIRYGSG
ncbi:MAG TPA: hypothetical protein VF234_09090, partial [Limnochordia bacterium]